MQKSLIAWVITTTIILGSCTKDTHFPGKNPNPPLVTASVVLPNSTPQSLAIVGDIGADTLVKESVLIQPTMNCTLTGGTFTVYGSSSNDVKEIVLAGKKFSVVAGITKVSGISINLPANKPSSVRYLISFNGTQNGATSGDTITVVPTSVTLKGYGDVAVTVGSVAPILVVNSGIVSVRIRPSHRNIVSIGTTDIFNAEIIVAGPHYVALKGFPVDLEANDYVALNTDPNSITANDSTAPDIPFVVSNTPFGIKGGDRQALFADVSLHPGVNVISFHTKVTSIGSTGLNNIGVFINDTDFLSWGDIAGENGNVTNWITGNAFIPGYNPSGLTIVGRPAIQ